MPLQLVPQALLTVSMSTSNSSSSINNNVDTSISLTTCGLLETGGRRGLISPDSCTKLQQSSLVEICGCQVDPLLLIQLQPILSGGLSPNSQSQQEQQQPLQTGSSSPLTPRHAICNVCGTTSDQPNLVTRPKEIVQLPSININNSTEEESILFDTNQTMTMTTTTSISCAALQLGGILGQVEAGLCSQLPNLIQDTCACQNVTAVTTSFLAAPHESCSICGNRRGISIPNHVVEFPHYGPLTCAQLQQDGLNGHFSLPVCHELANYIGQSCGCSLLHDPFHNTTATTSQEQEQDDDATCQNICGSNNVMGNPNGILEIPNHVPITCRELQEGGRQGRFSRLTCTLLPFQIGGPCNCRPFVNSTDNVVPTVNNNTTTTTSSSFPICQVCGESRKITMSSATVFFPGSVNGVGVACEELRMSGLSGELDPRLCASLPNMIENTCGCIHENNTSPSNDTTTTTTVTATTANNNSGGSSKDFNVNTAVFIMSLCWSLRELISFF